ncbi:SMP-30/gluconolactonase/LRE family protein [Devosia ginsengisoli]|uniref:SMP-30/gluconolactonase/LRE family protein n=1 Tax=Devosia ginsengisoli TaxID=400770 RepID=UPI0026EE42A3|nr:SMP-30/gluconolactonase/LRE family protein [Devosia ginsengisoli]MCR6673127.1 SMP-30/gluconolactonase/LRE family protein [Devosia ginsengisoli]
MSGSRDLAVKPDIGFLVRERFGVGESPVWDAENGRLLWCDIPAGVIHAVTVVTGARRRWAFGEPVPSFGLAQGGRLVVALRNDVMLFDPETGRRALVARVEHAKPDMRLNDGKVGPDGAFWVGSMDGSGDGMPAAKLYRIAPDGDMRVVAEGIAIANGLAWNAVGDRMYHSDSRGDIWLDCWDFDAATGAMSNRRRLREHDEAVGRPDGGACDMDGNYWSAGPSAGRLNRFSAEGELLDWIDLPIRTPTMPCFGDADMQTIYVTSLDSKADEGRDGVVRLRVDVPGVPVGRFGA